MKYFAPPTIFFAPNFWAAYGNASR